MKAKTQPENSFKRQLYRRLNENQMKAKIQPENSVKRQR